MYSKVPIIGWNYFWGSNFIFLHLYFHETFLQFSYFSCINISWKGWWLIEKTQCSYRNYFNSLCYQFHFFSKHQSLVLVVLVYGQDRHKFDHALTLTIDSESFHWIMPQIYWFGISCCLDLYNQNFSGFLFWLGFDHRYIWFPGPAGTLNSLIFVLLVLFCFSFFFIFYSIHYLGGFGYVGG